ncbi:NAD-dependent epimerase/dehydratase family protein [Microlunatus soli]|uniref:Nucleoside-diphosphate-sugar epimerase n=1 Tax=Microlunatus soli TaxID=630515 RepID=A0A1H1NF12_9ACTN|nr:NAD-dependent epimerase/dehydratase family protein [Microlunatus soli]SDR97517.1 Nucleoside-diphosphate-sugar epimerase [Microlunatus soli]
MRILILGGTAFLSAATARQAVERGHQVSCLARGSRRRPPEGAEWIRADRDDGVDAYAEATGDWEAVIDVAMQPRPVREALRALADRTGHWTLVSTVSVYTDDSTPGQDESGPLHTPLGADRFTDNEDYGPAKVACEQAVQQAAERMHISRAGLIVGPDDSSDRFGYWPGRFARGGQEERGADDVLVPDTPDALTQVIDVDDLAGWLLDAAERGETGILNAVGDPGPLSEVLDLSQQTAGHRGNRIAVDPGFLVDHGVGYWAGPDSLPLWLPADYTGFGCRSNAAARAAGMRLRPLADTVERCLADERDRGLRRERRSGLTPETEDRLLSAWQVRQGS